MKKESKDGYRVVTEAENGHFVALVEPWIKSIRKGANEISTPEIDIDVMENDIEDGGAILLTLFEKESERTVKININLDIFVEYELLD